METKPLSIRGEDWEVELLVLQMEGREWTSAAEVATKLMRWNLSSLRRELNQRNWDRVVVRDRTILGLLAEHGVLGDSLPGNKRTIGHARSANLIALETLADLLRTLLPRWKEGQEAVRRALGYNNVLESIIIDDEEEEVEWTCSYEKENDTSDYLHDYEEENDEEESNLERKNGDPCIPSQPFHKRRAGGGLYNYGLPIGQQCTELRNQLKEFQAFMTQPVVMNRQSARVEPSTVVNACQCMLRYLGYCFHEHHVQWPTLDEFKNLHQLKHYIEWLLQERNVQPQTIESYLNTAISVLKFLHREEALPNQLYKDIANVETLRQMRRQIRGLERFEPPTHEQLARRQKWLPWDQIVKTLAELEQDYLSAPLRSVSRARSLMEYLIVALYVYFPPVRAGPIRQLAIGQSLIKINGKWHLDLRKYKTFKVYGPVITEIHNDLVQPLESYLDEYRLMLLLRDEEDEEFDEDNDHQFVFVNRAGQPFTISAWTSALQSIFRRKTGHTIGATLLRDSFVTYVYSQDHVGENLKESIALHMGHRVDTAKQVYDRRTSLERRLAGVAYASQLVQQIQETAHREDPLSEEETKERDDNGEENNSAIDDDCDNCQDNNPNEDKRANEIPVDKRTVAEIKSISYGRNKRRKKSLVKDCQQSHKSNPIYYWAGVDMLP